MGSMENLMQMAQMAGGGAGRQRMPMGGGGDPLQMLMAQALPLLQNLPPQAKMALGGAMQDPKMQQMAMQMLSDPQIMGQVLAAMGGGPGIGGQGVGMGPATDSDLNNVDIANEQMRGGLPPQFTKGDYAVPEKKEYNPRPQGAEEELEMIQQMMGKGRG